MILEEKEVIFQNYEKYSRRNKRDENWTTILCRGEDVKKVIDALNWVVGNPFTAITKVDPDYPPSNEPWEWDFRNESADNTQEIQRLKKAGFIIFEQNFIED